MRKNTPIRAINDNLRDENVSIGKNVLNRIYKRLIIWILKVEFSHVDTKMSLEKEKYCVIGYFKRNFGV